MTVAVAFELSTSLHGDCSCDNEDVTDWRTFEARVRKAHPLEWEWASDKHPTNDSAYIDRRNQLGGNPKREPNPDAMPKSWQRTLTRDERTEHKRRQRRWAWADRRTYDDSANLIEVYVHGRRMSLAQMATFIAIADGIPSDC